MNTTIASLEGPRRGYYFPMEDTSEGMATYQQKRNLTDLICYHIDAEQRENYLNQLRDLSKQDAEYWILEFEMGMWK